MIPQHVQDADTDTVDTHIHGIIVYKTVAYHRGLHPVRPASPCGVELHVASQGFLSSGVNRSLAQGIEAYAPGQSTGDGLPQGVEAPMPEKPVGPLICCKSWPATGG